MSLLLTWGLGSTSPPAPPAASGFEAELVARLTANTALAALVGSRIYPLVVPQTADSTQATLVYAITGNQRVKNLSGACGIATARVHFDVRSRLYSDCKQGQEILRQYDGFRGLLASDVNVLFCQLDDQADSYEWPADSSDRGTEHLGLSFRMKYRESLPIAP